MEYDDDDDNDETKDFCYGLCSVLLAGEAESSTDFGFCSGPSMHTKLTKIHQLVL